MTLFFSLTHNCQLRCNYCYAGKKVNKSMSKKTLIKAIDFAFKEPIKKLEFGFFGGEPLLEWELLQFATTKIEHIAQEKSIELVKTVTTNGVLLDEEKSKWLREHGFYVVVSIDGNEKMHNIHRVYADGASTFKDVQKGILALQKYYNNGEYCVNSVVTKQNILHLNDSVRYLFEDLKISTIRLSVDYFTKWGEETKTYYDIFNLLGDYVIKCYQEGKIINIDIFDSKIKTAIENSCLTCKFAEQKIGVAPSGTLYPCERLIGDDTGELAIGDVYRGYDLAKKAKLIATRENTNPECQSCLIKSRCINSCGCTNYYLTGSINTTDAVVCFFQTLFVEVADKIASALYKERSQLFLEKFYKD